MFRRHIWVSLSIILSLTLNYGPQGFYACFDSIWLSANEAKAVYFLEFKIFKAVNGPLQSRRAQAIRYVGSQIGEKSWICLEGKLVSPRWRNYILFHSSQQLPRLGLGHLNGYLKWHIAFQGPSTSTIYLPTSVDFKTLPVDLRNFLALEHHHRLLLLLWKKNAARKF